MMHICSIYCQESIGFSEVDSVVTGANAGKFYSFKVLGLGWNNYEWGKPIKNYFFELWKLERSILL